MLRDNTAAGLNTQLQQIKKDDMYITSSDRKVLRDLAKELSELAVRPSEKEKEEMWYCLNALEETRPLVFCDPENGWNEILTDDDLLCTGILARELEYYLRKGIWWATKMNDDRVTTNIFNVGYIYTESDWGMHETKQSVDPNGSYRWDPPLRDLSEISKLHYPFINIDYPTSNLLFNLISETFGDILYVRRWTDWWWTLGLSWTLIQLRGLEQMMYDMYDNPEGLHRVMAFLRDGTLEKLNYLEKNNLLLLNCRGDYVGSGGFGWSRELPRKNYDGKVTTMDMWGFCESQETVSVHPDMFGEFIFKYQLPILERFGLNCYGCCEPLDKKWYIIKNTPRLRRVSVSPWCNVGYMAEQLEDKYILSIKPHPAKLAIRNIDIDAIRSELRTKLTQARGCRIEIIMKDNHTIGKNPQNVIDWVKIAKEEAERWFG